MQGCQSYLEARRIQSATIQAHHLEFDHAPSAERIIARLGEDIQVAGQPLSRYAKELLWIPYVNSDGAITSWTARIFPTPADPHPKFLTRKGGGGPPYITPAVWAVADNATVPVILTEGPIKTLACLQAGFPAIGLNGVYGAGARDAEDKVILHPLLSAFSWVKRSVFLAFDADITSKFDVRKALFRTFLLLANEEADVFHLTSWDPDAGKGIDDYLARSEESPEEVIKLLIADKVSVVSILEKTPSDLRLVEEELKTVMLKRLARSQLCRQVAKMVGLTAKELLQAVSPITPDAARDREVKIADDTEPWDGPVDGQELLKELYTTLGRPVWVSDAARMMAAFWIIAEYGFKAWRKFPYLRIKSADKNCGKSTLVDTLKLLVFKPLISGNIKEAGLYWAAELYEPTLLLDNFDNPERIRELTELLDSGYDADRIAIRCNTETRKLEGYRTYGPKIIASIRHLPGTTESRSLVVDMERVPPDKERQLEELCDIDPTVFLNLKRKILAFVEDHWAEFQNVRAARPDWLKTRNWDLWRPLFVVADIIGGPAPNWVQAAARGLFKDQAIEESLAVEILAHLRGASKESSLVIAAEKRGKSGPFLPSQVAVDYCNGDEEASWANWKSGDSKGLTIERLAKELRLYFKIKSDQVTYQNHKIRGYWLKPFEKLFNSFLSPDEEPPPSRPSSSEAGLQTGGSQSPPIPEDMSTITKAGDEEKGNAPGPLKNTPRPVPYIASTLNTAACVEQAAKTDLFREQVQNDDLFRKSDSTSTDCELWNRSRSDFTPSAQKPFLAIDVETSATRQANAKVSPDALDPHKAELSVVSAATPDGNVIIHDFRKGPLPDYLRAAIATTPLIAHGAAFDLAVLQANGYATSKDIFCTLTASRLLTAGLRDSNDLGAVLRRHLGLEIPKELSISDFGGMFLTDDQLEYCRNDVTHLHRLREALQAKLVNPADEHGDGAEGVDLVRVGELEMALIPLMVDIRLRGIQVDRPRLEQILSTYEARTKQLAAELRTQLQAPKLNFAAPDQLLSALKGLGLELSDTSKDTLSAVVDPVAGQLLRYREIAGLCQTMKGWLEALDSNNRLYPPLNPLGDC